VIIDRAAVRFAVLGPVRVWRGDHEVDAGSRQQRLILALLLARAGQPVGLAEFIALVWDERPPRSAANIVHLHLGRLRRLLEPGLRPRASGRWVLGDAAGYRVVVGEDQLDLLRFRSLVQRARAAGDPAEALPIYAEALELWRGPFAGAGELIDRPVVDFETVDNEYADVVREATDGALRAGAVRGVLPALRRVARQRPFDEAVQARLLLALSAAGQQAEAIALFQDLRGRLADDLGIDPGRELQEAYQIILRDERSGPVEPPAEALVVRPAQLLPDLPHFTGRDDALDRALALVHG
jgi:DNA-binding SARP family transcriptional activator